MVTTQVLYLLSVWALAAVVERPTSSSSPLSTWKKTGRSGESRFRSSSERLAIASSASAGGGGTGSASSTRVGGGGGAGVVALGGATDGGGAGATTGGLRRLHPAT